MAGAGFVLPADPGPSNSNARHNDGEEDEDVHVASSAYSAENKRPKRALLRRKFQFGADKEKLGRPDTVLCEIHSAPSSSSCRCSIDTGRVEHAPTFCAMLDRSRGANLPTEARHGRWKRRYLPVQGASLLLWTRMCNAVLLSLLLVLSPWLGVSADAQMQQDPSIRAVFRDTFEGKEVELERMIMDRSTNRLYVGGVNHLYDIAPHDLSVREHAITGPRPDSPLCADALKGCNEPLLPTDSYTKALAIDQDANKLIECTSLYQGRCRTRNLSDIRREADIRPSNPGIVANDRSSTVIFVGTGPQLGSGRSSINIPAASSTSLAPAKVLYVASTYVPISSGPRDSLDVPSVSSLSLEPSRLFEYTSTSISSGTLMKLFGAYAMKFRIEYAGGFESGGFAYFATRQPKYTGENQPTISKLVRICTQDPNFYSYTEIPLECMRNGVNYNLVQDVYVGNPGFDFAQSLGIKVSDQVLFAVFARGEGPERNITTRDSALCAYPLRLIEEKFFENIRECYKGTTRTNLPWFNSDKKCTATRYPDSEIMCGKDVNSYIGGEIPVVGYALLIDKTSLFTATTVTSVQSATIAFIGTASGVLHKALIEGQGESRIFKSIQLTDGLPILQDMELDDKNGLLYTMSKLTLYKVNVRMCSHSLDCHSCLETGDPFCGWCMRQSACTTEEVCTVDALFSKADWFNYKSGRCPMIRSVEPMENQISTSKTLHVHLENAPSTPGELACNFMFPNLQVFKTPATPRETGVTCATPSRANLRNLGAEAGATSVVARFSVVKTADNSPLASTNFTFYDCNQFSNCTACATSKFPCDWCTISSKCVPNAEDVCQGEALVNAFSRQGPSSRRGPEHCPRFESDGDIYVSSGRNRQISVRAHNIQDQMQNFKCQYTIDQSTHERPAARRAETIICDDMRFEYFTRGLGNGTAIADFSIVWYRAGSQTAHALDNSQNLRIVIYKCEQLAVNCGLCLGLDLSRFECGWCNTESRCTFRDACPSDWMTRGVGTAICPNPRIDDFYPKKGPINGGTKITITGVNLGLTYGDVREAVRVASAKCDVSEHEYVPSTRIVCHTRAPSTKKKQGQHVVVKLKDDRLYTAVSNDTFTYVNPVITEFRPYRGPRSGGTDVTILGTDLDSGSAFNVTIGNVPCRLIQRSSSMVVCRTGPTIAEGPEYLILNTDGTQFRVDNVQFQYSANPNIERVQKPQTLVSGGIAMDVFGKGLDLLQRPRMVVTYEDAVYYGPRCELLDEHLMVCRTPALDVPISRRKGITVERPLQVDYGFDLDGTLTGNLTVERAFPKLNVFVDPKLAHFPEVQLARAGGDLVIKGENLNLAAASRDVRVAIDGAPCNVTALSASTLTCQLPLKMRDDDLEVHVYVGDRAEKVGYVSTNVHSEASNLLYLAIVIAVIGVFLAILLFVLYRRKSTSHNRQLRYLKTQMNSIEMKVAQECKEAFHELQTNMNALVGSVPQGASFIPFFSYRDYAARILFPHAYTNHPVLRELSVDHDRAPAVESGLRQLHRLVQNKTFLLAFVRTIDENKYLLLKDRVYVGSLLMVILQERMEYCTDVLKQLLKELIRRNVDSKFQPKILFRRAESVAERMLSAWFSFLMYKFLRRGAGKPLYQLYWATKQQTEKGPQDAITTDARYSLSEEKLLRSTFEFRELTVFVVGDGPPAILDTQVRVLDCDSITQVKEKCLDAKYRTTPFSERPSPSDIDLELRTPTHRIILQARIPKVYLNYDLDATSKVENGVWRYNTLAHYKVENKATLALLPRQASSYNLSLLSDRSEKSSLSLHNNSPTFARPFGTTGSSHSKDQQYSSSTLKAYHLVKPAADHGPQDNQEKMVTEIYLTRLLTMKGTLQRFIEDFLETVFSTSAGVSALPMCIKYMFDFLDEQAIEHGIVDPDVVHAWKSNALPLRFWVNLIKNPDFIFDIQKPTKIEGSLNVVAQTLMDACSTQEHQLTKDSPSSKLLFANEIDRYKSWVHRYYGDIRSLPPISDQDMNAMLAEESRDHSHDFLVFSALNELYVYVNQNKEMIFEELSQSEVALQLHLPEKFQKLLDTMDVTPDALIISNGQLDNFNSKSRLMANSNSRFY